MHHQLVADLEKALGWSNADGLGVDVARGTLPDPALCERLLTPTRLLDLLMRRSLEPPRLRCLVDGTDLHPQQYLTYSAGRRGHSVPMVNMARLGELLRSGATLVVDHVDVYDSTMEVACRALQWWARERVQVNTYLTTSTAAGFDLHWDDHDVIVVQLAGAKSWDVCGLSRPAPMYRDAEPNLDPPDEIVWSGTMRTGDVLHIPRGHWHRATRTDHSTEGFSLHATFGFPQRTGVDWLAWLADEARRHEVFRHDLDRTDPAGQQHTDLTQAAQQLITTSPYAQFLRTRETSQPPARHVRTHDLFGPARQLVCITDYPPRIVDGDQQDTVVVAAAGRTLTLDARARPALETLLSGHPVDIDQLDTSAEVDPRAVAQVLVDEELCAEVTDELATGYAGLVPTSDAGPAGPRLGAGQAR
ncbi:JmjC domain-containing protein [Actinopolyspora halophila]|uniref:JmjC domain-containing protein n=1 Tax=Actinopolyspora halophila TaxID=1850 RepID=UPI00039CC0D3